MPCIQEFTSNSLQRFSIFRPAFSPEFVFLSTLYHVHGMQQMRACILGDTTKSFSCFLFSTFKMSTSLPRKTPGKGEMYLFIHNHVALANEKVMWAIAGQGGNRGEEEEKNARGTEITVMFFQWRNNSCGFPQKRPG